jgi:hypothetical protein
LTSIVRATASRCSRLHAPRRGGEITVRGSVRCAHGARR